MQWYRAAAVLLLFVGGCFMGEPPIDPPSWDPSELADAALKLLDKDGDQVLNAEELEASPGLASGAGTIDANGNQQLERAEIEQRFKLYEEMGTGLKSQTLQFTLNGRPLAGAEVRLVPEPFLADLIEPASGTTDQYGVVTPFSEGHDYPAVRLGFYRFEVKSPALKSERASAAVKKLGIEVSPVSDGYDSGGMVEFDIRG